MSSPAEDAQPAAQNVKPFRFKRKSRQHVESNSHSDFSHHRRRHHHGHHRSKRNKTSAEITDNPSAYDDSISGLPPDTAFRESLFDAMADDEGAAYWESVYGQPIHNYPREHQTTASGELDQMTEEEYAQYVRRKMWEKSWEGIEAAREEKRQERVRERETARKKEQHSHTQASRQETEYLFDLDIDNSLRRGERRKERKRWKPVWDGYLRKWNELDTLRETLRVSNNEQRHGLEDWIAWPLESGRREDLDSSGIEYFLKRCAESIGEDEGNLGAILKSERVRWHPDKIQQRYGSLGIDDSTLQGVTAVFQVLDRMWNDYRAK